MASSPIDSALTMRVDMDSGPAEAGAKRIEDAIQEMVNKSAAELDKMASKEERLNKLLEKTGNTADSAKKSLLSFSGILGGIVDIGTKAVGIVSGILLAPAKLDNYLGVLNTRLTQSKGMLESYGKAYTDMRNKITSSSLAFGIGDEAYQQAFLGFAQGMTAKEKLIKNPEEKLTKYTEGVGGLMTGAGFDVNQAVLTLNELHKSIGLNVNDMPKFSLSLSAIARVSNMSAAQLAGVTNQASKLAKAFNLGGEAGKKFVIESLAVGGALSQIGMDAESTLARMNEISSGSEQGLIQSLILGFKPGDPQGQLKSFQEQAKTIVGMASGVGEQFAPFLIKQLGDAMGLKGFTVEEIRRLASGASIEDAKGPKQENATDILHGILEAVKNPATGQEERRITIALQGHDLLTKVHALLENQFMGALNDLKRLLTHVPDLLGTANRWLNNIKELIGGFSLAKVFGGAAGLASIPIVIKLLGSLFGGGGSGSFLSGVGTLLNGLSTGISKIATIGVTTAGNILKNLGMEAAGNFATNVGGKLAMFAGPIGVGIGLGLLAKLGIDSFAKWWSGKHTDDINKEKARGDSEHLIKLAEEAKARGDLVRAQKFADKAQERLSGKGLGEKFGGLNGPNIKMASGHSPSGSLQDYARTMARKYGIPESRFLALIEQESSWKTDAVSKDKGALGLGQLRSAARKDMGVTDPMNPYQNLEGAAKYLAHQYKATGDWSTATLAYHQGLGGLNKPLDKEAASYVPSIEAKMAHYEKGNTPQTITDVKQEAITQNQKIQEFHDAITNNTIIEFRNSLIGLLQNAMHNSNVPMLASNPYSDSIGEYGGQ